jgi:hypothetical protein
MPAFTFEKITPPVRPDAALAATIREPHGVVARMLGRLSESRTQRAKRRSGVADGLTEADIAPDRAGRK